MKGLLKQWRHVPRLARHLILLAIIACVSLVDNYEGHRHQSDVGLFLFCQTALFIVLIGVSIRAEVGVQRTSWKRGRSE
jgi:hypothetical protein